MRHIYSVAGGRGEGDDVRTTRRPVIDCLPLTATGEALIQLDGDSVSDMDRALGGEGAFTIQAVWRIPILTLGWE